MTNNDASNEDDSNKNAREFWESYIGKFDASRHARKKNLNSFIYWATRNPHDSIVFRRHVILEHLSQHSHGKRIVELGCGAGRYAQGIIDRGAQSYQGYDIADASIDRAMEQTGLMDRIAFKRSDIGELTALDADIVFTTGVIPCLSLELVDHLFSISGQADFFHTINEPHLNLRQYLRTLYQRVTNTYKYQGIRHKSDVICGIAKNHGWRDIYVFRHPKLYTLACLSSLPFPESLGPHQIWGKP